jgi:hypothetical protein
MKVGDLVKPCDVNEKAVGLVITIKPNRIGADGLKREVQVSWFGHKRFCWAMRMGVEAINESR